MRLVCETDDYVPEISVVAPLFNEEENLPELYRRIVLTLESACVDFEIVFVDDGSRDNTSLFLHDLHFQDSRVMVVSLSRNFGHQPAISAGLDHATGKAIIVMDADLQDPPEVLPRFIDAWRDGNDVVYAVRTKRKEGFFKRCCYSLFYRLMRAVSDLEIPLDSGDFCLMDRKVVEAVRGMPERNRFMRGLRAFVGFKQVGLSYERDARYAGTPKYTYGALWRLARDGIVGFSSAPLSLVAGAGTLCLAAFLINTAAILVQILRHGNVPGWAIMTLALFACSGIQLFALSIVGEYVRRIFVESKARPTYIVGAVKHSTASSPWQELHSQPRVS